MAVHQAAVTHTQPDVDTNNMDNLAGIARSLEIPVENKQAYEAAVDTLLRQLSLVERNPSKMRLI